MTRKEAKAAGLKWYLTGEPCKNGHIAERRVSDALCVECSKAKRLKTADGQREYMARYREEKGAELRAYDRQRYAADAEAKREWHRAHYAANIEAKREKAARWRMANPDAKRASNRGRKALHRNAEGRHTAADIAALRIAQGNCCGICGADLSVTGEHVDHMTPLSRGGGNSPDNLMLLCPPCNLRKNDKTLGEYLALRAA